MWGAVSEACLVYLMVFDIATPVSGMCEEEFEKVCMGREECGEGKQVNSGACFVYVVGVCVLLSFIVGVI